MLHLRHQLWGAVWGLGRRGGLSPPISLQLLQTAPAAQGTSPRAKVWRGDLGSWHRRRGWRRRRAHTPLTRIAAGRHKGLLRDATEPPAGGRPPHRARRTSKERDAWAAPRWRGTAQGQPPGPARPRPARPRLPSAAAQLPGVPFGGAGSTRARPWRAEPSPFPGAARHPPRTLEPPLASFLPREARRRLRSSSLTLKPSAALLPPRRRREAAVVTEKRGPAPGDAAAARGHPLTQPGWGHAGSSTHPRSMGTPAPPFSGSVDSVLVLEVPTQQTHFP